MPKQKAIVTKWEDRSYSLTLAGCLAVAGMPLPQKSVKPHPTHYCTQCGTGLPNPECYCYQGTGVCPHTVPAGEAE